MVAAVAARRVECLLRAAAASMPEDSSYARTAPWRSRWDQSNAEFVASDSEWCDRLSARLIALVPGVDYVAASRTALDLAGNDALRALAPEWVAEDLARVQIGL